MDGIILINKEKEWTSHDVVNKVKKILNEKVGHTGTLDPLATGVLPLLIGKGTLCSKYLINHDKTYKVKLELGKKTETADSEGKIIEEKEVLEDIFNEKYLNKILKSFIGKQKQMPPIYSAIKVNGKKLYEYARNGQNIKVEPRNIEIYNIKLLNFNKELNQIDFEVSCSKGTYIRSLCEDIAIKFETVGFMKELERTKVGKFELENCISVAQLEEIKMSKCEITEKSFISIEKLFNDKNIINLTNKQLELFLNGVKLSNFDVLNLNQSIQVNNEVCRIYNNNKFIGIGIINDNLLKRDVIL